MAPRLTSDAGVVLLDRHPLLRAGVRRALEDAGHEVVAEAADLQAGLEQVEIKRPWLVVVGLGLPGGDVFARLPDLRRKGRASVLVLADVARREVVTRAFEQGADGFLLHEAGLVDVADAARAIRLGRSYLYPPLGAHLAGPQRTPDALTPREVEIVRLLALGHTNREVGRMLHLSVRTVESHRSHIAAKLRISARSELVRWALRNDLLAVEVEGALASG
jgi:two-component system response regulator NreC